MKSMESKLKLVRSGENKADRKSSMKSPMRHFAIDKVANEYLVIFGMTDVICRNGCLNINLDSRKKLYQRKRTLYI